jgi:uncharacterized phage protein (TIGR02218 family)
VRTLPPGLGAHLASGATTLCHCWKLMPVAGATLGFTDHDRDLIFDGVTFEAQAGFEASEIESSLGLSVDNLEASGALDSAQLDAERLRAGDFDHAAIEIWRVNWQDVSQRLLLRKGHLGEVTHGGAGFTAEVRGLSHLLNQTKGRVFQFGCDATLGDARCTVNLETAAHRGTGTIVTSEDNRRFTTAGLDGFAAGWFSLGHSPGGGGIQYWVGRLYWMMLIDRVLTSTERANYTTYAGAKLGLSL